MKENITKVNHAGINLIAAVASVEVTRLGNLLNGEEGFISADTVQRQQNAVSKASQQLLSGVAFRLHNGELLVSSPSGNIYAASRNRCQCEAYNQGQPCWHRAAFGLVTKATAIDGILSLS